MPKGKYIPVRKHTPEAPSVERFVSMIQLSGQIEVDLFPENVNSLDHPHMVSFKALLEKVAEEYKCNLLSLEVERGTVKFSFDSPELMAEVVKLIEKK